jgi:hypothetical protein
MDKIRNKLAPAWAVSISSVSTVPPDGRNTTTFGDGSAAETGTYMGHFLDAVAGQFEQIYTVEIDPSRATRAEERQARVWERCLADSAPRHVNLRSFPRRRCRLPVQRTAQGEEMERRSSEVSLRARIGSKASSRVRLIELSVRDLLETRMVRGSQLVLRAAYNLPRFPGTLKGSTDSTPADEDE